jgi:replicative DNA helicase
MTALYSYNIEKHVLGGLVKNPEVFADIDTFVTEKDFYSDVHSTIYCCVRDILLKDSKIDQVILAQRIKNLGISFKDDINIFDYIDSISFTHITAKATIESAKELVSLRVRRDLDATADKIKRHIKDTLDKGISTVISEVDAIYGEKVSGYYSEENGPQRLLSRIIEEIEIRSNSENELEEIGFAVPYPEFNRLYGGLRPKCLYSIIARPGNGKTTFLNDLVFKTCISSKVKALILDTEMPTEDIEFRMFSAISQVPVWHLETGQWRRNTELVRKTNEGFVKVKEYLKENQVDHYFIGDKSIDEVCSIVRRWKLSEVGRENRCIIALDYLKLTGEKVNQSWLEYQAIGEKVNKLKKLAIEIDCPIITAVQSNRSGEGRRVGDPVDSSVISLSDRIQWFSDFTAFLTRKIREEMAWDGEDYGTHMLVPFKTRYQGRDAAGHQDLVRRRDPNGREKYYNNFLNFHIENFNVEERGSLHDIAERERAQHTPDDASERDGELL